MKKLALVLTFCSLFLSVGLDRAQAGHGASVQLVHHLPGDNFQFGFSTGDFYFQFGPNSNYFGWNRGYRYWDPYSYAPIPNPDYYYYSPRRRYYDPRPYQYYSPPRRYYNPRPYQYYSPPIPYYSLPPLFYFPY